MDNKKYILLQGMSGIGKSNLIGMWTKKVDNLVFENINYKNYISIDCRDGIKEGFLKQEVVLRKLNLDEVCKKNEPNIFSIIIGELAELENLLLVLDNLPAHEPDQSRCKVQLNKLCRLSCDIIATSCSEMYERFEVIRLQPLSEQECIELFLSHADLKIEDLDEDFLRKIKEIVNIVGRHTLVIELFGKLYEYNYDSNKPLEFLHYLKVWNLSIEGEVEYYKNDDVKFQSIDEAVSTMFSINGLKSKQKIFLYHIALMNSHIFKFDLLVGWLGLNSRVDKTLLKDLVKRGWLQRKIVNNNKCKYYHMHPVVSHTVCNQFSEYHSDWINYDFYLTVLKNIESSYHVIEGSFRDFESTLMPSIQTKNDAHCLNAMLSYVLNSISLQTKLSKFEYLVNNIDDLINSLE